METRPPVAIAQGARSGKTSTQDSIPPMEPHILKGLVLPTCAHQLWSERFRIPYPEG